MGIFRLSRSRGTIEAGPGNAGNTLEIGEEFERTPNAGVEQSGHGGRLIISDFDEQKAALF